MDLEKSKQLANDHWLYIESILLKELEMQKKMYIDAFIHGYKHGVEDEQLREKKS